jgi:uncharacterized repeat protein (TIGR03809 family)
MSAVAREPSMQARSPALTPDQIAQRWRDLAERRRSYFIELYESGRWKHYYTEADFVMRLREVFQAADRWEKLASPRPPAPTGS